MNDTSTVLIHLLSCAIHNKKPSNFVVKQIDWNALYEEAVAHQVHTLIYPTMKELSPEYKPTQMLRNSWHKETILEGTLQLQHIDQISIVLNQFKTDDIPVIALKGLVLRNYYPSPELRTMGDADILVKKEDLARSKNLLKSLGYSVGEKLDRHISFHHKILKSYPSIELHWLLNKDEITNQNMSFTNSVWENAIETKINSFTVLTLSPEDQIVHLLLHSVQHIMSTGFGLRQLCDLVLFIEGNETSIEWEHIIAKANQYGIHKFAVAILSACNKLFDMEIPAAFYNPCEEPYIDLLIDDIINAGVYGRRYESRVTSTRINKYIEANDLESQEFKTRGLNIIRFLFPTPKKLGIQYTYAKKLPILLPIAWVHRGFHNIKRLETLRYSEEAKVIGKERARLLHWLRLR